MRTKHTLIVLLILAALGGYYYVVEVRVADHRKAAEQAEQAVFVFDAADIAELTLTRPTETIRIAKQDAGWNVQQPVNATADAATVAAIVSRLAHAERGQHIAARSDDLAQFGLDPPELVVSVTAGDAGARGVHALRLGRKTPTSSDYYAQVNDNPAIFTAAADLRTGVDKTLYDVRDKTVLAFEPAQITQAEFGRADSVTGDSVTGDSVTGRMSDIVVQRADDRWTITAPRALPADTAKMGAILSTIKSAAIQAFVDDAPGDLAQYGLERPRARVTVVSGAGAARQTLLLGATDEAETGVYAKLSDAATVVLVPPEILDALPKSVNDVRDTTLFAYNPDTVQRIEVAIAGQPPLALEKIAAGTPTAESLWNIVQPAADEAVTSAVRAWLSEALSLTVQQFVTDDADDLSLYGLDPPQMTVTIGPAAQERPQELRVGHADAQRTGIYARFGDQHTVVLVNPEAYDRLARSRNDFRDTRILRGITDTLAKISLTFADAALTLEKKGGAWSATAPEQRALTSYKVHKLLYDLGELKFRADLRAPDADIGAYGLDDPDVTIMLWEQGRQDALTVQIGKTPAGPAERYLRRGDAPTVYVIDADFLDELPKSPADLIE